MHDVVVEIVPDAVRGDGDSAADGIERRQAVAALDAAVKSAVTVIGIVRQDGSSLAETAVQRSVGVEAVQLTAGADRQKLAVGKGEKVEQFAVGLGSGDSVDTEGGVEIAVVNRGRCRR